MSKENIIRCLTGKITTGNLQILQSLSSEEQFLKELVRIFENKVRAYLSSCERKVKQKLREGTTHKDEDLQIITVYHIINFAYSAILEFDKTSFLLVLNLFLKELSPELSVSLGMHCFQPAQSGSNVLHGVETQLFGVFIQYIARYRLFKEIGVADLAELCKEVATPNIYPQYLLQAFVFQEQISQLIQADITEQPDKPAITWSQALTQRVNNVESMMLFDRCLRGVLFYVNSIIKTSAISPDYQQQFFAHLENEEKTMAFIDSLYVGFIQKVTAGEQQRIYDNNAQVLQQSAFSEICMPALSILGLEIKMDDIVARRQAVISKAMQDVQMRMSNIDKNAVHAKEQIDRNIVAAIAKVKSKIDEQNRMAQERIAQIKPQWCVGTSIGFKF